uniref:Casein kinase I n=1 Tax=Amphora coffeiformis TaxID=265554 RepID=A0A7S3P7U9_9STRA
MSWVEPPSNPEGLVLYDKFKIGRKLGEGAQSAGIHAVVDGTGKETEFVVKLAKKANPKLPKRKFNEQNQNAVLLNGERQRYKAYFKGGTIVPSIPSLFPKGPKAFEGTTNGYSYMIIEKMEMPLWDCIDELIAGSGNAKEIDLSEIAQQFFHLAKAVHEKSHTIVDVKPDNFMFAKRSNRKQTYAELLRLVDLGLWKHLHQPQNVKVNELTGNAMYCSLNMQAMDTPSLCDDMQMMVIIIAELVIRVNAKLHNEADKYEKSTIPSYLPWSQAKSENAVFQSKEKNVLDRKSEFYKRMPKACADTIFKLIGRTQEIEFNQKPNYDKLTTELQKFTVPKPDKRKAVARVAKQASATRSTRAAGTSRSPETPERRTTRAASASASKRRGRSTTPDNDKDEIQEDRKPSARKKRAERRDDPMIVDLIGTSDDEDDDSVEHMDIDEPVANEQENLGNRRNNSSRGTKKKKSHPPAPEGTMVVKECLLVTVKRGKEVLESFDAYPDQTIVFGSSKVNNFKSKIRKTIPAGQGNHCSIKVVGVAKKPGQTEFDKILSVEVEHMAKTGSTELGDETLGPTQKKTYVAGLDIPKGRVGRRCKITIGDVHVTFQKV